MPDSQTTLMILVEGRNALSLVIPRSPRASVTLAVLLPLMTGVFTQRYVSGIDPSGMPGRHTASAALASLSAVGHGPRLPSIDHVTNAVSTVSAARSPRENHAPLSSSVPLTASAASAGPLMRPLAPAMDHALTAPEAASNDTLSARAAAKVLDVKAMLRTLLSRRNGNAGALGSEDIARIPRTGVLRLEALHLNERVEVYPFDAQDQPDAAAMAQVSHAMRCRITGTEVAIDPKLIEVLVRLHTLYGRAIQLVSGHRQPNTIGTKPTSQHALGRAADIRIPGVNSEELKRVALKLGARGAGLYPEKGFVHIDVRPNTRYSWSYTAARGEISDARAVRPVRVRDVENAEAEPAAEAEAQAPVVPDSEAELEASAHDGEPDIEAQ